MSLSGRFEWSHLGDPDYAQAAALVAKMPKCVKDSLRGKDEELLRRLLHLSWLHAVRGGRGRAYCAPSQGFLARVIGRCSRSVRRALRRLEAAGLIVSVRRRPLCGKPQTNLYELGKRLLAAIYSHTVPKTLKNRMRTKMSDNNLKKSIGAGGGGQAPYTHSLQGTRSGPAGAPLAPPRRPAAAPPVGMEYYQAPNGQWYLRAARVGG